MNLVDHLLHLQSVLRYEEQTGRFYWREKGRGRRIDLPAGGVTGRYWTIRVKLDGRKVLLYAHRLAWLFVHGELPGHIDHRNGDGLDNRIANLRCVTQSDNLKNQRRRTATRNTPCMGVYWSERHQRWYAYINKDGKRQNLLSSRDLFTAVAARKSAERAFGYDPSHGEAA